MKERAGEPISSGSKLTPTSLGSLGVGEGVYHVSKTPLLLLRWACLSVLLIAEYWLLIYRFSLPELPSQWEWLTWYKPVIWLWWATAFCAMLAMFAIRRRHVIFPVFRQQSGYRWWIWALLQICAFAFFVHLTAPVFGAADNPAALSAAWLVTWAAAAFATFLFWVFAVAPPSAWQRFGLLPLTVSAVIGVVVQIAGIFAQTLWLPLAKATLHFSYLLLSFLYPEVTYDTAQRLVGTNEFVVEIGASCSGYEGIALVSIFVTVYLWIFRYELHFPKALLLYPIGIVAIWTTNVLRVSALVLVGTLISPEIADGGFHSQAGWLSFTVISLGLIALSHRWWLSNGAIERLKPRESGSGLAVALLVPFLALMAVSMITAAISSEFNIFYPISVIITGAILWHYRKTYYPLFSSWSWQPPAIGTAVFVLWVLLESIHLSEEKTVSTQFSGWSFWLVAVWIVFRVIGSVVIVPLAEELAFRGYLIRKLVARDFESVPSGQFSWLSFFVSSVLFGLLHQRLLAGTLAGAAFALALYRRGQVGDAVIAHATSNALIAVSVLGWGYWGFWA